MEESLWPSKVIRAVLPSSSPDPSPSSRSSFELPFLRLIRDDLTFIGASDTLLCKDRPAWRARCFDARVFAMHEDRLAVLERECRHASLRREAVQLLQML